MMKTFKPVLLFHFSISVVLHSLPSHQPSYVCSPTICISNPILLPFPSPTHAFLLLPRLPSIIDSPSTPLLCHSLPLNSFSIIYLPLRTSLQGHSNLILPYSSTFLFARAWAWSASE